MPATPTVAIATPPTAGPAIMATSITVMFQERAFGRCWRGTSAGMIACRAGMSNAPAAAATKVMA